MSDLARADDKQACSDAYAQTQTLRREGKLEAARESAVRCGRDVCAAFIRAECGTWFTEIEASQPSVVFEVRDAAGRDTTAVRVWLDGKPWLDKLEGKARSIDPGQHTLRYEIAGEKPLEETVQIREGEKNRKLTASFQRAAPPTAEPPVPVAPRRAEAPVAPASRSIAPWIVGGVGVAGAVTGAVTLALAFNEHSVNQAHCSDATRTCDAEGRAAASTGQALGTISTVGFVVGGLGLGVSAVWLLTRGPSQPAVSMGPRVTPEGGSWRIEGRF
jgi:hypothetical protein